MKTTRLILCFLPLLFLTACRQNAQQPQRSSAEQEVVTDSVDFTAECSDAASEEAEQEASRSLNDIRFAGWSDEDWLDNDYIRELRSYIDAYCRGAIYDDQSASLQDYKSLMKSRFVIYDITPFLYGGVWMLIGFLENPKFVFEAWVYSEVDAADRVVGYEVRGLSLSEQETDFTKEHILRTVQEHPELKLW